MTPSPSAEISGQNSEFSSSESSISGAFSPVDRALQDLGASVVGNEIRIDLPADILFDFDQSTIRSDANAALQKLLTIINAQASSSKIQIEGHTDAIADDNYNQKLSERRANAVKSWLIDRGIFSTRLTTQGFGESRPVAPNTKPDGSDRPTGRQKNRRVQVTIQRS
ncbi:OmpA family protein [Leptolyngbya sp. NIES-2104]|uniref:OmpA family protein n=1 Tax=Leptolyngbya sp. NIES-2104 TaxID=1552121 RepID=UPI0006EC642F|nr:OmpA family protein [Leptolyngbya sp. NIES-2104]GAP94303.1 outer membrane protein [Leptolyngbya sp. NIES-2104]